MRPWGEIMYTPTLCPQGEIMPQHVYSCGRNSVIWGVSSSAMKAQPSGRLHELAMPKKTSEKFLEDR